MKQLIIILSIFIGFNVSAQTTAIPDANFEQNLIILGFDSGAPDGLVLTSNIDTITNLVVNNSSISDLTGIEDFISLKYLSCYNNQLAVLDISQNTNLIDLYCNSNQLTTLNVSQNISLEQLYCFSNQLTNLDVNQNTALKFLLCSNNQLTTLNVSHNNSLQELSCFSNQLVNLNVSQNISLVKLQCSHNQLSCLNVKNGNNTNFTGSQPFLASSNPNLICIEVDDVSYSVANWTDIDAQASFDTSCANPCVVGVDGISISNLSIYPNPTNGIISIDLGEVLTDISVTLTNSLGQVVLSENYASTSFINIDINAPKGIYFLQLETNGEVITKKIIKE
tara:strand:- start:109 stop:1119 length:1011 start_codon:yes stop_codon:yes gene_type:complete